LAKWPAGWSKKTARKWPIRSKYDPYSHLYHDIFLLAECDGTSREEVLGRWFTNDELALLRGAMNDMRKRRGYA
jgi:hypothetical protein